MTTKNYNELIQDRIYFGGADDVKDMMENENADVIFDGLVLLGNESNCC